MKNRSQQFLRNALMEAVEDYVILVHSLSESSASLKSALTDASLRGDGIYATLRRLRNLADVVLSTDPIDELQCSCFPTETPVSWSVLSNGIAMASEVDRDTAEEAAKLIADTYSSSLEILKISKNVKTGPINRLEFERHLEHIRDHFDYSQSHLVECLIVPE